MVVHNQPDVVRRCLESLRDNTRNYKLYVWDNASDAETSGLIKNCHRYHRSEKNVGFIIPNNRLAAEGDSPYIILLNSDTVVRPGWKESLIGHLENNDTALVGFQGGIIDGRGVGVGTAYGDKIDYVAGWCMAMRRTTYEEHGLFDEQFEFAYAEDSDLSYRLKSRGLKIYALHLALVDHVGGATIKSLNDDHIKVSFTENHKKFAAKWLL